MDELLDVDAVAVAVRTLADGWTGTVHGLTRSVEFADFPTAVEFVARLAPRCEALDHHPDIDIRWRRVDLTLSTHSAGGVTAKDVRLAGVIDELAAALPHA